MIGPDPYAFRTLHRHYRSCRRGKRNTRNALAFELDAEAKLLELQAELREHRYRPGRSICFVTGGPKPREVFAADFRDRVVHHLLVGWQEPLFERRFVHDSFACRRGKGTLAASDRLVTFLRRATANGRRPAFALKLDVANFFPSIEKARLYEVLARQLRHPELLWLARRVLFHDPTRDYVFRSRDPRVAPPETPGYPVPAHKSLFGKGNRSGLPIGNLPSQFWANVYLNELDQFVKRTLRVRHYVRYVDDLVLLGSDPEELASWQGKIEGFLAERLGLALRRDRARPVPATRGVDFVGWKTWWSHRVPRRRTLGNLRTRVARFEREALRPACRGRARRVDLRAGEGAGRVQALHASLASYSGHLRHGATAREWARLWQGHPWLRGLFEREGWQLGERWPARRFGRAPSFRRQYRELVRRAGGGCLVFCRVGRFVEFYGPQRRLAEAELGLRTAALPRAGYALAAGFPAELAPVFRRRALGRGLAVVEVREQADPSGPGRPRVREVAEVVLPVA